MGTLRVVRNSAFSNPLAVRSPGICFFAWRSNRTTEVSGTSSTASVRS